MRALVYCNFLREFRLGGLRLFWNRVIKTRGSEGLKDPEMLVLSLAEYDLQMKNVLEYQPIGLSMY